MRIELKWLLLENDIGHDLPQVIALSLNFLLFDAGVWIVTSSDKLVNDGIFIERVFAFSEAFIANTTGPFLREHFLQVVLEMLVQDRSLIVLAPEGRVECRF